MILGKEQEAKLVMDRKSPLSPLLLLLKLKKEQT